MPLTMKILFVCKALPHRYKGGIQTHVWQLACGLIALGHRVSILTGGSFFAEQNTFEMDGIEIVELAYFPGRYLPIVGDWLEEHFFNIRVNKWLSAYASEYDIVHIQGRSGSMYGIDKNRKTPLIATFHGLMLVENRRGRLVFGKINILKWLNVWLHERWATYYEHITIDKADAIIAVSREMQREILEVAPYAENKIRIISNGVDVSKCLLKQDNYEAKEPILLFIARIAQIKGIFDLLKAAPYFSNDIQLRIVGEGPDMQRVKKWIRKQKLEQRITIIGTLSHEKILKEIQNCYALILPSYHETQGIVILEANALGKPVVATQIPGIDEIVQHDINGLTFPVGDIESMITTVNTLFDNPDIAHRLGTEGVRLMTERQISWLEIAKKTQALYEEVIYNNTNSTKKPLYPTI